jgi:hypothetical protein
LLKLKYILIFSDFVVQYASQVSAADVYSTMDGFISLLVRDIHDWGLLLKKYNPLRTMVATNMDNKGRPILLPERAVQLPIGELLKTYFSSSPFKIYLCLACEEKDSEACETATSKEQNPPPKGEDIKPEKKIKVESERGRSEVFINLIIALLAILIISYSWRHRLPSGRDSILRSFRQLQVQRKASWSRMSC